MNSQLARAGAKRWTACPTSLYLLRVQEHSLVMGDSHPRACHATYTIQYGSYKTKHKPLFLCEADLPLSRSRLGAPGG